MRVPMLILALVAVPLVSHEAEAQWWTRLTRPSQNSQQGNKAKDNGNHEQKGEHKGNNEGPAAGATISGTVYEDKDGNGAFTLGEPGVSGWKIDVTGGATPLTATSSATGTYSFAGLLAGSYNVCATPASGWALNSRPRCWTADVTAANATASFTGFDFGGVSIPSGGVIF